MRSETFHGSVDLESAISRTKETGYFFAENALSRPTLAALNAEIESLPMELDDHIATPLNAGKINEVQQRHERIYTEYSDAITPVATLVIASLTEAVRTMKRFPELCDWQPSEIGYQRYRNNGDFIGAHRDRASDKLLSVIFTITGSAPVRIFETLGSYRDYSRLKQVDEFMTTPGSVMLLRAAGLGNGEQVVHQVLPPLYGSRAILNLRMRGAV